MAVAVKCGTYEEVGDLAGMTISEVRQQFEEAWNIDPQAVALVNGEKEDDDYILQDGEKVEFTKSEEKWD